MLIKDIEKYFSDLSVVKVRNKKLSGKRLDQDRRLQILFKKKSDAEKVKNIINTCSVFQTHNLKVTIAKCLYDDKQWAAGRVSGSTLDIILRNL